MIQLGTMARKVSFASLLKSQKKSMYIPTVYMYIYI